MHKSICWWTALCIFAIVTFVDVSVCSPCFPVHHPLRLHSSSFKPSSSAGFHTLFYFIFCLAVIPSQDVRSVCDRIPPYRSFQTSGFIDLLAYTPCLNVETHWSVSGALRGEAPLTYSTWRMTSNSGCQDWLGSFTKYLIGVIIELKLFTLTQFETVIE